MPENSFEADFFGVLEDLKDYLSDLTLVGGWVPYIYAAYLWRNPAARPVFTSDVDWGVGATGAARRGKTIFDSLSALRYTGRHLDLGKAEPVVFYRHDKTRLDFIVPAGADEGAVRRLLGGAAVSRLEHFDFLLKYTAPIKLSRGSASYELRCPRPSAFVCHKCATFSDRLERQKMAKDLYYAYFVLRYAEDPDLIAEEMAAYRSEPLYAKAISNLRAYFGGSPAPGCAMVAQENGPDYYIDDLESDILTRFQKLLK